MVQWFARVSEVPASKLKLLGREPHPQEIFYYQGRGCDDEVNAESILRPVQVRRGRCWSFAGRGFGGTNPLSPSQVKHLDGAKPFPDSGDRDTLYVKLSWDSKAFKMVDPGVLGSSPPPPPKPSLPLSPPCSPSAAAPASRGPVRRALPTPDPAVIHRASSVEVRCSRLTMSAGRAVAAEAESLHSATKLSASKCLSARRREATARTPGVRKRLQLSSESKKVHVSVADRCSAAPWSRDVCPRPVRSGQDVVDRRGRPESAAGRGLGVGGDVGSEAVVVAASSSAPHPQPDPPQEDPQSPRRQGSSAPEVS